MLTGGRISLFQRWLNALPPGLLESRPVLLGRHGLVLATLGETARGLGYLDQSLARYQAANAGQRPAGYELQLAWIYLWRALVYQIRGSYANALDDAASALALAERDSNRRSLAQPASEYTWLRSEAYRIRGLCLCQLGKLDDAIRNFSTSLSLHQAQGNLQSVNLVLMNLGAAYLDAAEFGSALACYKQALDYYQPQNDPFSLSSVLNDVAFLHHLRGEYSLAFTTFEEALAKAIQGANLRVQALVLIGMGDLHLDLQALEAALDSYHQARPITEQLNDRFLMIYLDLAEAAVARLKGDFATARQALNAASQISQDSASDYFRSLHQLESGRLALAEQDFTQAANLLSQAAAGFEVGGQRVEAGRSRLLLAAACFELGDLPAAKTHLEAMFQLVDRWENQHSLVPTARLVRPFLQQVVALATTSPERFLPSGEATPSGPVRSSDPLLGRKALRLLDQVDFLDANLVHWKRRMRRQSSMVAPSPPHLQIYALGRADVLLQTNQGVAAGGKPSRNSGKKPVGQLLTSADWQTQVTRDLFFLILSERRSWTKEEIGELLWPDCTKAQLKLRFKNTIYRLRRALQQDAILFEGDSYSFNWGLDFEYDVEQFLEQINQADECTTPKKKIKALQTALELYRGDYLPEVCGAWALTEQERLRQVYLEAGLQLARLQLEAGQNDQALGVAARLMAVDACLEAAYVIAMQAQAAAGNRPAIPRIYEKLSRSLLQELRACPSPRTESIYQSLKDGQSPA
jgi:DNA-binding SARP family transcriptional activator/tetratricopeptide (TPR) repeat protein